MKNYTWAKGYKYVNIPTYLFNFRLFGKFIRIWKTGYKRRRVGGLLTKRPIWLAYEKLLTTKRR